MAKELIGFNSVYARQLIRNSIPLARAYLEKERKKLIIPLYKEDNGRDIVAYKVATEEDKKYILDELIKRKNVGQTYVKKFNRGIGTSIGLLPTERRILELQYLY